MIPTIDDIVRGLVDKTISGTQAHAWLEEHLSLARLYAPLSPPDTPEQIEQRAAQERQDLRDHFAAKAMQAALGHAKVEQESAYPLLFKVVAQRSYEVADAMLAARDA